MAVCLLLSLAGCQGKSTAIDRAETQLGHAERAGNSAQAYHESGSMALADLAAYVSEAGRPVYDVTVKAFARAAEAQAAQQAATAAAQREIKTAREESAAKDTRIENLEGSFWSPRQKRLFAWIIGLLALATVLRIVGIVSTGPIGRIAAFGGTAVLSVVSMGTSLIQAGFDNLWFRWRAKKETPDVHPGLSGETEGSVVA